MPPGASRFDARAYAALLALALAWGYNWVAIKVATLDASPFVLTALRTVVGAIVLFALAAVLRRPLRSPPVAATAVVGLLNVAGFYVFQTLAVAVSDAGRSAILAYTYPFWTALLAWPLLGERVEPRTWLGLLLAALGLGFVLAPIDLVHAPAGKLFALATALDWSLGSIATKRFRARHSVDLLTFTAWQTLYGALPLVAIALLLPGQQIRLTPGFGWSIAYIGVVGTGIGMLLWLYALDRLQTAAASLASLLTPVIVVFAAALQLAEIPSPRELLGIGLILGALAVNSAPAPPRKTNERAATAATRS